MYNTLIIACVERDLSRAQQFVKSLNRVSAAFRIVCSNGFTEMAEWMLSTYKEICVDRLNNKLFNYACMFNHVEIAKLLYKSELLFDSNSLKTLFINVAQKGNIDVMDWMYDTIEYVSKIIYYDDTITTIASLCSFEVIRWMLQRKPSIINVESQITKIFSEACEKKDEELIAYLISIPNFFSKVTKKSCFSKAYYYGNYSAVKYFIDNVPSDKCAADVLGFNKAFLQIYYGDFELNVEIVELMLSLYDEIDIPNVIRKCYVVGGISVIPIIINYFCIDELTLTDGETQFQRRYPNFLTPESRQLHFNQLLEQVASSNSVKSARKF